MNIIITSLIISGLGISFLVLSHIKEVRMMTDEELTVKLEVSRPLLLDLEQYIIFPIVNFWHNFFLPKIYHACERVTSGFRFLVSKVERKLHDLANYIRGKKEMKMNEASRKTPYWNEINDFKKDLGEGDRKN